MVAENPQSASFLPSPFKTYQFEQTFFHILLNAQAIKWTGEMKMAGDFQLTFSYFLSDHHDFSPIRVAMRYSRSSITDNLKK